jgi:hypothetical protein
VENVSDDVVLDIISDVVGTWTWTGTWIGTPTRVDRAVELEERGLVVSWC